MLRLTEYEFLVLHAQNVHDLYSIPDLLNRAADFKRRYDQLAWNILKLMNDDPDGKLYNRLDWALLDRREVLGGPTRAADGCPHAPNMQPGY